MLKQAKRSIFVFIDLLQSAWIEYQQDRAQYLAVAMIYYAIVSLVPLFSLLLSALGLLLRFFPVAADIEQKMMLHLEAHLGIQFLTVIRRLLEKLQRESIASFCISLVGLLLAASVLLSHLRLSFRAIWNCEPLVRPLPAVVRTIILEKIISVVMVLGGAGLLIAALVLSAALQWMDYMLGPLAPFNFRADWLLSVVGSLVLGTITFALLFKFLPPIPIRLRDVRFAALACALVWVAADEFIALFGVFFTYDRSVYGALGGVLAAMVWMNIVSQAFFFGAELCKVSAKAAVGRRHHYCPDTQ